MQEYITIGYAATRKEGLQMLAEFNQNPFDVKAAKITFQELYERWSKEKSQTTSESNVHGYFISLMEQLGFEHQPHDTRHTCISLPAEAHVDQTMIKKIVHRYFAILMSTNVLSFGLNM